MMPLATVSGDPVSAVVSPLAVGLIVPLLRLAFIVAVVALLVYLVYRLVT